MIARSNEEPELGRGIYSLAEVGRLIARPYSTVRSWFKLTNVLRSDYAIIGGDFAVSFHDLIDTLVAAHLRDLKVPMNMVRKAYLGAGVRLQTNHPFCHRGIYTDGRRIIIDVANEIGNSALQDAVNGQGWFSQVKNSLAKVSYSNRTKLADRWNIASGVLIDPGLAMGYPVVSGTGITTSVISRAFYANGSDFDFVGKLFNLSSAQVKQAVNFERTIKSAA